MATEWAGSRSSKQRVLFWRSQARTLALPDGEGGLLAFPPLAAAGSVQLPAAWRSGIVPITTPQWQSCR